MFLESPWNIGTYLRGNIFFIVKNQFYYTYLAKEFNHDQQESILFMIQVFL